MSDEPRLIWRLAAPTLLVLGVLVLWQWYSTWSGVTAAVLPPPTQVASGAWQARATLMSSTMPTLRAALLGFALAVVVGFAISVLIDFWRPAQYAVTPLLIVSQTLPLVVLAPLMVLWLGFGLVPKVLLVALITFFPITISLVRGYASTGQDGRDVMRAMGSTRRQEFVHLRLPVALPAFFTGVRIAITYAVIAAIFAEYAGATEGLGVVMQVSKNAFRTDLVLAAVAISSVLTLALYGLTFAIERVAIPWHYRVSPQRESRIPPARSIETTIEADASSTVSPTSTLASPTST